MAGWFMGFLWVNGFSFFHCVASPFHSFVTTGIGVAGGSNCNRGLASAHRARNMAYTKLATSQRTSAVFCGYMYL